MPSMFSKQSYPGNEWYENLAEMCRKATAKDLRSPDERLKQSIVLTINNQSAQAVIPPKVVCEILVKRLQMDKPHKQYLAIDLVRKVLAECSDKMRMYRPELLNEIGRIANKPGKNGSVEAQRGAKKGAIDYLMSQGPEGQHALMMAGGHEGMRPSGNFQPFYTTPMAQPPPFVPGVHLGPTSPQSARGTTAQQDYLPTGDTIEDVKQLIELANGHSEVLEELITASTDASPGREQNPLIRELLDKVNTLKQVFPGLLERLSADGSPAAEALMAKALAASDVLDNCLELQSSVQGVRTGKVSPGMTPKSGAASPGRAVGYPTAFPLPATGSVPVVATAPPAAPAAAAEMDLLSFDAAPPAPAASGAAAAAPATDDPFGFMDLAISAPAAPPNGAAPPAKPDALSGNPFEAGQSAKIEEATAAAVPSSNPFAAPLPMAAAPYGGAAQPYAAPGMAPAGYAGAPAPNPFGSSAFGAAGMAPNPFQQAPTGYAPAMPPGQAYAYQPVMPPGAYPLQMPVYPAPQAYQQRPPPQPQAAAYTFSPQQRPPAPAFAGGFPTPHSPENPFAPQMPGLPQAPAYPPPKKYTNAFDDLLSDVAARPKSATPPPPMAEPMVKPKMSPKPATPRAAQPPAPAAPLDPFDMLVAQNANGGMAAANHKVGF